MFENIKFCSFFSVLLPLSLFDLQQATADSLNDSTYSLCAEVLESNLKRHLVDVSDPHRTASRLISIFEWIQKDADGKALPVVAVVRASGLKVSEQITWNRFLKEAQKEAKIAVPDDFKVVQAVDGEIIHSAIVFGAHSDIASWLHDFAKVNPDIAQWTTLDILRAHLEIPEKMIFPALEPSVLSFRDGDQNSSAAFRNWATQRLASGQRGLTYNLVHFDRFGTKVLVTDAHRLQIILEGNGVTSQDLEMAFDEDTLVQGLPDSYRLITTDNFALLQEVLGEMSPSLIIGSMNEAAFEEFQRCSGLCELTEIKPIAVVPDLSVVEDIEMATVSQDSSEPKQRAPWEPQDQPLRQLLEQQPAEVPSAKNVKKYIPRANSRWTRILAEQVIHPKERLLELYLAILGTLPNDSRNSISKVVLGWTNRVLDSGTRIEIPYDQYLEFQRQAEDFTEFETKNFVNPGKTTYATSLKIQNLFQKLGQWFGHEFPAVGSNESLLAWKGKIEGSLQKARALQIDSAKRPLSDDVVRQLKASVPKNEVTITESKDLLHPKEDLVELFKFIRDSLLGGAESNLSVVVLDWAKSLVNSGGGLVVPAEEFLEFQNRAQSFNKEHETKNFVYPARPSISTRKKLEGLFRTIGKWAGSEFPEVNSGRGLTEWAQSVQELAQKTKPDGSAEPTDPRPVAPAGTRLVFDTKNEPHFYLPFSVNAQISALGLDAQVVSSLWRRVEYPGLEVEGSDDLFEIFLHNNYKKRPGVKTPSVIYRLVYKNGDLPELKSAEVVDAKQMEKFVIRTLDTEYGSRHGKAAKLNWKMPRLVINAINKALRTDLSVAFQPDVLDLPRFEALKSDMKHGLGAEFLARTFTAFRSLDVTYDAKEVMVAPREEPALDANDSKVRKVKVVMNLEYKDHLHSGGAKRTVVFVVLVDYRGPEILRTKLVTFY